MEENRASRELEEWKDSLRGLPKEEGYAERYSKYIGDQSNSSIKIVIGNLAALVLFGCAVSALVMGWVSQSAFAVVIVVGTVGIGMVIRKLVHKIRQERRYTETAERQNGIDRRWGR